MCVKYAKSKSKTKSPKMMILFLLFESVMPKNFSHLFESIDPDTTLLVAVSGGIDSMVLLDMCLQYWDRAKIQVIHVHHGIR